MKNICFILHDILYILNIFCVPPAGLSSPVMSESFFVSTYSPEIALFCFIKCVRFVYFLTSMELALRNVSKYSQRLIFWPRMGSIWQKESDYWCEIQSLWHEESVSWCQIESIWHKESDSWCQIDSIWHQEPDSLAQPYLAQRIGFLVLNTAAGCLPPNSHLCA